MVFTCWYTSDGKTTYFTMLDFMLHHPNTVRVQNEVAGFFLMLAPVATVLLGLLLYSLSFQPDSEQKDAPEEQVPDETVWPPPLTAKP